MIEEQKLNNSTESAILPMKYYVQPFWKHSDLEIYNESNLDTMSRMPNNCIDLTVTSPPYEDFRKYNGFRFDLDETVKQLYRVTKKGGVVVWVIGDKTKNGTESGNSFRHALKFIENGWLLNDTMIWVKTNPMPTEASCRYKQTFEYMFVFSKGKPKTFNPLMEDTKTERKYKSNWGRKGDYMISSTGAERKTAKQKVKGNVFYYPISVGGATKDKLAFEHPAIFPEQLAADHIISWSNEGDLIYEPFSGSGTVGKMSFLNRRKCIMSEISSGYCELSKQRLLPYTSNIGLFS